MIRFWRRKGSIMPRGTGKRRHFHAAWLLLIAIPGFAAGGWFCRGRDWSDKFSILCDTTLAVGAACSIPLGISYGVQKKDFWLSRPMAGRGL